MMEILMFGFPYRRDINSILRLALYVTLLAVLGTPFLFWRNFVFTFVVVRVFVFQGLIGLATALWLALVLRGAMPRPQLTPLRSALLIFIGVLLVTSLTGVDIDRSFWSVQGRSLGLVALFHFALFSVVLTETLREREWPVYLRVSAVASIVAAAFTFVQIIHPEFFLEADIVRPGSFLGNPTFLAAYLLPHIFFMLWFAFSAWERTKRFGSASFWVAGALFESGIVLLTQTRGALLGLLGGVAVVALVVLWRSGNLRVMGGRVRLRQLALALLGALAGLVILFVFTRSAPFWQRVPGVSRLTTISLSSPDIQPRLVALRISWAVFRERPILGHGFENFKYAFDAHYDPKLLRYNFGETYFDKPHNIVAEYAVSGGIMGLFALVLFFGALFWRTFAQTRFRSFAPFGAGLLVAHLVNDIFVFDTFGSYLAIFLFLGYLDSASRPEGPLAAESAPQTTNGLWNWRTAAGAMCLLLALVWGVANFSILRANNGQYWVLNYLLFRRSDLAASSYERAVGAWFNPYRDAARIDFASSLAQVYLQGVHASDDLIRYAMQGLRAAINNLPNDYFYRVAFADAATVFVAVDPSYIDDADRDLARALELSPKRQQTYYAIAKVRIVQGRMDDAFRATEDAVALDPEVGESHFYAGLIAFESGKPELGFKYIETAARLGRVPRTAHEMRVVANYYADAGRYPEAIALYQQALGYGPSDLEAKLKLGIVYFYSGDTASARQILSEVAQATDIRQAPTYELLKPIFDAVGVVIP